MTVEPTQDRFPAYNLAPVSELIPYARNARTHSEAQVAQLAASIREFGFTNPILVDGQRSVIAGHGRLLAARKLGMVEVPTLELRYLTPAQRRAYVLADNRLALSAGWDAELLRVELGELQADGFDLALTGFEPLELAGFLAEPSAGLTDPDDVPAMPEVPVSRLGDVWRLGRHRLACGDSTDPATVAAALGGVRPHLLGGVRPHLMVTDPPYGVEYDPAWRNAALDGRGTARVGKVLNDHRANWREAWALFPGEVAYVWHGALHAGTVADSLTACGFGIRAQVIWAKERLVLGRGHYHWQHEPCWYAVRDTGTGHWSGDRKQTTLWSIASRDQDALTTHGTQKPVECMRRPIENNSCQGQAVYVELRLLREEGSEAALLVAGGAGGAVDHAGLRRGAGHPLRVTDHSRCAPHEPSNMERYVRAMVDRPGSHHDRPGGQPGARPGAHHSCQILLNRGIVRPMGTMNVSLPDGLKSFVDDQVAARGYSTSSEYVRELIRKEQERERLRRLLLDGAASAPTAPADDAYFDTLRRRVRQPQA